MTIRLSETALICLLGVTQIMGWGTLVYAYGVLMLPMEQELHLSSSVLVGGFSLAFLISAVLSVKVGSMIDRLGGRNVMTGGSLLAAMMLIAMSRVSTVVPLYLVWAGIGVAMSATLYQAAFAVLTQNTGSNYRRAITGVALFAGLASTIGWLATQWGQSHVGWRVTWLGCAAVQLFICLPLHALLPRSATAPVATPVTAATVVTYGRSQLARVLRSHSFYCATTSLTLNALVYSAVSVYMISILHANGLSAHDATLVAACVGPSQVVGRLLQIFLIKHWGKTGAAAATGKTGNPFFAVAFIALAMLPCCLLLLFLSVQWMLVYLLFAVMYGASVGIMTIVRGVLPAELYGTQGYGAVSGAMSTPVMITTAIGPFIASLLYSPVSGYHWTLVAMIVVSGISAALFLLVSRFLAAEQRAEAEQVAV